MSKRAYLWGASYVALSAAGALLSIAPAFAAETVETVVVTAERRSVDLQKTTLAATVLTPQDLTNKGVFNLTSLQSAAPGITINDYGSANVFNMRGVGREAVDVEIPSGVAIYRDGVPTLAGYFQGEPYYDMAGVEVLRGPQGTFAGQSASGGAVFIRTVNPDLNGWSGYLQAGVANYTQFEVQGAVNVPLTDDAAMRVSVNHVTRDDTWYHLTGLFTGHPGTRESNNVRASFLWKPVEQLEIVFKNDLGWLDLGGNPVSLPGAPLYTITLNDPMKYRDKSWRSILDMRYHFDNGMSFHSLTGFQTIQTINNLDADGGGPVPVLQAPPFNIHVPVHNSFLSQGNFSFYSQEFNLLSPEDTDFRWVLGAFAEREVSRIPDFMTTGLNGFSFVGFASIFIPGTDNGTAFPFITSPWRAEEDDLAVFGNAQYDFTKELTLETGLRFSYNHRHQFTNFLIGTGFAPPFFPFTAVNNQHASGDYIDGKIALQWKPDADNFLYAEGSRGHTVKSINIFPPNNAYKPVEVWNYEVGWKSSFFDSQLRTQLDAYYENIGNYQAVFGFVLPGGVGASETRNARTRSTIWGIEASGQAVFGDLAFDFGGAYLNSKLGEFPGTINPFGPPPLGDRVANAEAIVFGHNCNTGAALVNLTGSQAPFSPDFTGNVGVQYAAHVGEGWTLTPRADLSYADANQADLFACSLETIKSRTLLNLQLRIEDSDSPWWGQLWATNVTDYHYVVAVQNIPPIYYAGAPLQIGFRVGRSF
jgi:iron complex outermembrane receptor protein